MRTPPPAAPRRGPIADGAARMRRPSVLSEGQNLAADGIYFRPRFFNRVPTGAGRACGWSCIRELGATPTSKKMTNGPRYGRRLPRRGPIADGAARTRRPSVLSEGQNLAADGIYFRPRFFNRVPTGAGRACGWSCTPERWGTRISNEHYWAPVWLWFSAAPRRGPAVVRSIQKDGPPLVSQLNRTRRLPENPAAVFL